MVKLEKEPVDDVKKVETIVVIHDKIDHSNVIIASETTEVPVKPETPVKVGSEKPETKEQPEEDTEGVKPHLPQEKYTVVEGATLEAVPEAVQNIISKVTEEVVARENVNQKDVEVVQTLIRTEGKVEKIQQILNVTYEDREPEQILVTAIANK